MVSAIRAPGPTRAAAPTAPSTAAPQAPTIGLLGLTAQPQGKPTVVAQKGVGRGKVAGGGKPKAAGAGKPRAAGGGKPKAAGGGKPKATSVAAAKANVTATTQQNIIISQVMFMNFVQSYCGQVSQLNNQANSVLENKGYSL